MNFFQRRKARKSAQEALHHARFLRHMREDLLTQAQLSALSSAEERVRVAMNEKSIEAIRAASSELLSCVSKMAPAQRFSGLRENFEILVVALAVAMAFRTYFLQPFKIPTGSMQPTLMGIITEEGVSPGAWDRLPLKPIKWLITGKSYVEVRAKCAGTFREPTENDPNRNRIERAFYVQTDGGRFVLHVAPRGAQIRLRNGQAVSAGELLWSGIELAGDHVFVDRVSWNFRSPQRGQIVVFSTDDIGIRATPPVVPGTHYIKRLIGLPGDSVSIQNHLLVINGEVVIDPRHRAQARYSHKEYPAYSPIGVLGGMNPGTTSRMPLIKDGDVAALGSHQFFAMGDNTESSLDSRFWGAVPEKNLVGPAFVVYWPFSERWGFCR